MYKDQRETWCCKVVFQETVSFSVDCELLDQGTKSFRMVPKPVKFLVVAFFSFTLFIIDSLSYMFNLNILLVSVRCPVAKESRNEK